jgi:hypothetical protein
MELPIIQVLIHEVLFCKKFVHIQVTLYITNSNFNQTNL